MRRTFGERTGKPKRSASTPMDAALKYLTHCARTVREVERNLDECEFGEVEIAETVNRLIELHLLDDAAYARDFIQTRLNTKPVSRAHLREQLRQHEVPEEIVEEALLAVDGECEQAGALAVAEKFNRQFEAMEDEPRYERVLKRLLSRGYSFETAKAAMEQLVSGEMEEE